MNLSAWVAAYKSLPKVKCAFVTSLITFLVPAIPVTILFLSINLANDAARPANQASIVFPSLSEALVRFASSVIVSPLWETGVYHVALLALLMKVISSPLKIILVSAAIFSAGHAVSNSILSGIMTILPGILWAYVSITWHSKTGSWKDAYTVTCLAHSLHNLYYFAGGFIPASWIVG